MSTQPTPDPRAGRIRTLRPSRDRSTFRVRCSCGWNAGPYKRHGDAIAAFDLHTCQINSTLISLTGELSERARNMIDFAARVYRHEGNRDNAIRELFGLTATAYAQQLNQLIDQPAALTYKPALVGALRHRRGVLRDRRRCNRDVPA